MPKLDREKILDFFTRLDPELIHTEQLRLHNYGETTTVCDSVYRVFHHSFKMYGFRPSRYVEHMLRPLGYDFEGGASPADPLAPYGMTVLTTLAEWGVSDVFLDLIRPAQTIRWSFDRNKHENWIEDARVILSATLTAREVSSACLAAMDRMVHGTGFLWDVKREYFLDDVDAMFLEVWEGLGLTLRYGGGSNQDLYEEARRILTPKLRKPHDPDAE